MGMNISKMGKMGKENRKTDIGNTTKSAQVIDA